MSRQGGTCPEESTLLGLAEGWLTGDDRDALERHLDGCRECRHLLMLLQSVDGDAPPQLGDALPRRLGRYEVGERLGAGGMGVVHGAYDPRLDRQVAIKVLHPRMTANAGVARTLVREARAMARLSSPHVVQVFDAGVEDGCVYVAMERWPGPTLRSLLSAPLTWPRARALLLDVAAGVEAAHAAGVIHRDLKPDNVLIGPDGRAAVSDFGLAAGRVDVVTDHDAPVAGASSGDGDPPGAQTTPSRRAAGTPAYMAPEQHVGDPVDARTDVFGFCVMAYELLYGVRPFTGSPRQLLAAKLRGEIAAPWVHVGPRRIRGVLRRGMAAAPERRWATMAELRRRLEAEPRRRTAVLGLGVGLAAALGLATRSDPAPTGCPEAAALELHWSDTRAALRDAAGASEREPDPAQRRVEGALDDYVHAWAEAWRAACPTGGRASTPAQAAHQACLEPGRAALDSLWAALAEQPAPTMARVEAAVAALPSVAPCRGAADPSALDPEVRAQQDTGHYREVLERAEALAEQARALEYKPLIADTLYRLGWLQK
ncbi:MAG: serine/threonine protein kinase, partial [Myxococcales bacterium]|nr:serine/threonine protein kinase [Myxococcales bacterium]